VIVGSAENWNTTLIGGICKDEGVSGKRARARDNLPSVGSIRRESSRFRFGVFDVDLAAGELRKAGVKIRLQEQPFQVLAILLERAGLVVTRDELQARLWSADTFVDFDRGLNKAINRLREALDDVAERPRFIETLPKRGYRFVAPVEPLGTASRAVAAPADATAMPRSRFLRSSLLPPPKQSFLPSHFAISPDGTALAFVALDQDGRTTLWVRPLSGSRARRLDGTGGAAHPFWSPDTKHIGFFAARKLKVIEIATGIVRTLAEAPLGRGGTWNRDGVIVFTPTLTGVPLSRVDAAGGAASPATRLVNAGELQIWPSFLPGGRHFLVYVFRRDPAQRFGNGLYVGTLDSPDLQLISSEITGNAAYASGRLLYVHEHALVSRHFDLERLETTGPALPITEQEVDPEPIFHLAGFTASETGAIVFQSTADLARQLIWVDRSGRELGAISADTYLADPSLSPDGRLLAAASDDGRNGRSYLRVFDLERGVSRRLTSGGGEARPTWLPDGKTIAYTADEGRASEMRLVAADGSASSSLAEVVGICQDSWSPDGHVVFARLEAGFPRLSIFSASDKSIEPLAFGAEAQFSPDGKWIVYIGQGGIAGGGGVVVQPFPARGGEIPISEPGGAQPRWSRDGREIFYITPDRMLMAVAFDPGTGTAERPRPLFRTRIVAPNLAWFQYDVAPDGRFLINSFPSMSSSPLTLLIELTPAASPTF
jgi:eukaryotic-like serine/threonine-protein kinase